MGSSFSECELLQSALLMVPSPSSIPFPSADPPTFHNYSTFPVYRTCKNNQPITTPVIIPEASILQYTTTESSTVHYSKSSILQEPMQYTMVVLPVAVSEDASDVDLPHRGIHYGQLGLWSTQPYQDKYASRTSCLRREREGAEGREGMEGRKGREGRDGRDRGQEGREKGRKQRRIGEKEGGGREGGNRKMGEQLLKYASQISWG